MAYETEYKQKLVSAEQAVKEVKSGDRVHYGFFNCRPVVCDQALGARADELEDVHVYGAVTMPPVPAVSMLPKSFVYHDFQWSKLTRLLTLENPEIYYVPVMYHMAPAQMTRRFGQERKEIGFFQVAPMDEHGYFNIGPHTSEVYHKMKLCSTVILEVNQNMPVCFGKEEAVHITEIDYVVEAPADQQIFAPPETDPTETDMKIAENILQYIGDGACVQLGIGGIPNQVGKLIAQSDLKNLGGHTEMFVDAYVDMIESGRMNGSQKNFDRGKCVYTFAIGSKRMYDFMHKNPGVVGYPVKYTNDPRVIAGLDNFISICNAIQVDLYTQVNAESNGCNQISGNGGMWDFVCGSQWSKGGKSFICLTSTFKDKEGNVKSRIVPTFDRGTITTIPRQMTDFIVTEYGAARMGLRNTWDRAEQIVGLAHPDFREDLIQQAEKMGIWRRSNKKD